MIVSERALIFSACLPAAQALLLVAPACCVCPFQEGGRLTVALVGASALQPPAVVMLKVEGLEGLKASKPTDWEVLATSTALQASGCSCWQCGNVWVPLTRQPKG